MRIILIILFVYFLLKLTKRIWLPMIFGAFAKKVKKDFEKQNKRQTNNHNKKTEEPLKEKKKVGEYIDYEEVE